MGVRAVLVAGFVLLVVALAVTLAGSAPREAGSNHVAESEQVALLRGNAQHCQDGELIPKDASALRLLVGAYGRPVPGLRVTARTADGTLVTAGGLPAGRREGHVDLPVRTTSQARAGTRVCIDVAGSGRTVLYGAGGALSLRWLRGGSESWLELLPTVAHRFGLAKWNPVGSALLAFAALLVLAAWLGAVWLVLSRRRTLGRIPIAAWGCALVAFLNVLAWTLVTPPFEAPDETSHVAYVQYLAQHAEPPNDPAGPAFSSQQATLIDALLFPTTVGHPETGTVWNELQDDSVQAADAADLPTGDGGGIQSNSNQPPLYFTVEALAYHASPSHGLLDRLELMRVVSALLAGLTTLFVFLFLRESFAEPWTWTVGALAVAFQPVFGFISGSVTPDSVLFASSAALLFTLARAFRRGLTVPLGLGIGAALAVGVLAKLNFIALVPGPLLGLVLIALRSRPRPRTLWGVGAAVGVLALAALVYVGLNLAFWDRSAWGGGLEAAADTAATGGPAGAPPAGLREQLSYTWQLYLPRLPFMSDQFAYFPPYTTWFKGWMGLFGWLDTPFPAWVYRLAVGVALPLTILALVGLVRRRAVLRERWPEVLTYVVMAAGLLGAIGILGDRYRRDTGFIFEQARYLMPLLVLYGAGVALAALGAGRRLSRPVGAAIVVLALLQGVFAQLLVLARFYA